MSDSTREDKIRYLTVSDAAGRGPPTQLALAGALVDAEAERDALRAQLAERTRERDVSLTQNAILREALDWAILKVPRPGPHDKDDYIDACWAAHGALAQDPSAVTAFLERVRERAIVEWTGGLTREEFVDSCRAGGVAALAKRDARAAADAVDRYRASLSVCCYSQEHVIKMLTERAAEARAEPLAALERLANAAPPFTSKPEGAPHSPARLRQVEHIAAHAHATGIIEKFRTAAPAKETP